MPPFLPQADGPVSSIPDSVHFLGVVDPSPKTGKFWVAYVLGILFEREGTENKCTIGDEGPSTKHAIAVAFVQITPPEIYGG